MKTRKMLISISLIIIMVLSSIMPIFVVNADENNEASQEPQVPIRIELNAKLYNAIKGQLVKKNENLNSEDKNYIAFQGDDINHVIIITENNIKKVTSLTLKEMDIEDLTGLDKFTELEDLNLDGNKLTKDSNLFVLNNLPKLKRIDLSSNKISDLSDIKTKLFGSSGTNSSDMELVKITDQEVYEVNKALVNTSETSNNVKTVTFKLPPILQYAGRIKKNEWVKISEITPNYNTVTPPRMMSSSDIPMYITDTNDSVTVKISSNSGTPYLGMVELYIKISDSTNALYNSEFKLYYVVYEDTQEAITIEDDNLYRAIKEQLTGGQEINEELLSYPYETDANGDRLYEEFYYDVVSDATGKNYHHLYKKTNGGGKTYHYIVDPSSGIVYVDNGVANIATIDVTDLETYSTDYQYEKTYIYERDDDGRITTYDGYKIPMKGTDGRGENLYIAAYDDAKTFIIDDDVLVNKITSLELNNKKIRNLSGIELFVGLTSTLNVSHNFLENIDALTQIPVKKQAFENEVKGNYESWLTGRSYGNLSSVVTAIKQLRQAIEDDRESIRTDIKAIRKELKTVSGEEGEGGSAPSNEVIETYAKRILSKLDSINGNEAEEIESKLDKLDQDLAELSSYFNMDGDGYIDSIYEFLSILYQYYNNEYRLTTILAKDINYITLDEYNAYNELINDNEHSRDNALELLSREKQYISDLENRNALSDLEKELIIIGLDSLVTRNTYKYDPSRYQDSNNPIADHLDNIIQHMPMDRDKAVEIIEKFREINVYSEMASYCLIQRMNNSTNPGYCYEEAFLKKRLKEIELENLPTNPEEPYIEQKVLDIINGNSAVTDLYEKYRAYQDPFLYKTEDASSSLPIYLCEGDYKYVDSITRQVVNYDMTSLTNDVVEELEHDELAVNVSNINRTIQKVYDRLSLQYAGQPEKQEIYKDINFFERVKETDYYLGNANEYELTEQVLILAEKLLYGFTAGDYIYLPKLNKLDISYNAQLDSIGDVTALNETLIDLDASYCYIASLNAVDWNGMTKLKKLNLGYNFISNIDALIPMMKQLEYLSLSNNLIEGELNISDSEFGEILTENKLRMLDLSGNQITDVQGIVDALEDKTSNVDALEVETLNRIARYINDPDTIYIDLRNQKLVLNIETPISLKDKDRTIDVDLPPIFSQFMILDTERTAFGETSQNGRVENEGKFVTLNTQTPGEKVGTVVVKAMSGNGTPVETCVGEGTELTINYKVVDSILELFDLTISQEPLKTSYYEGDTFDKTGMKVKAKFIDTSTLAITEKEVSDYRIIDASRALTVEDKKMTVGYEYINAAGRRFYKETTQDIEVKEVEFSEIKVTKMPNKMVYFENEPFDQDGMEVTAYYTNGSSRVLDLSEYDVYLGETNILEANELKLDNKTITVKYTPPAEEGAPAPQPAVADPFDVTVNEIVVTELRLIENPDKINYIEEESFVPDGMVLRAYYSNGTEKNVPISDMEISPNRPLEVTDKKVKVSYGGLDVIVSVNVNPKPEVVTLTSIEIVGIPKTSYIEGDVFDPTGLVILAFYSNNTSRVVTNYTISDADKELTVEDAEKIITYTEDDIIATKKLAIRVVEKPSEQPGQGETPGVNLDIGYAKNSKSFLTNVDAKTPIDVFKRILLKDKVDTYDILIYDKDGVRVTEDHMKTGMTVKVIDKYENQLKDEEGNPIIFTVVVKGDVNCDGIVDSADSVIIKAKRADLRSLSLTEYQECAADVDGNTIVDAKDSKLVLYHRAEVPGYNLNYQY